MRVDASPPRHLSREARALWRGFVEGWAFDACGFLILQTALEAFDRMRAAQQVIAKDGLVLTDGRVNPASVVERDSRLAMLRALRTLNLDLEPLHDRPGRPAGG